MKRVNVRFVLIMSVIAIAAALSFYALHSFQVKRHAAYFLEQGDVAKSEGRVEEAIRDMRQYLVLMPGDVTAMKALGTLLAHSGRYQSAFQMLESVLRQQDDVEARRLLVDVLIRLQRFSDASDHLENHLITVSPKDPTLLDFRAQCQWGIGNFNGAAMGLRQAIEIDPRQIVSYLRLIALLDQHPECNDEDDGGHKRDAEYWSTSLVENNDESGVAHLSRSQRLFNAAFAAATKDGPDKGVKLQTASHDHALQAEQRFREAAKDLRDVADYLGKPSEVSQAQEVARRASRRMAGVASVAHVWAEVVESLALGEAAVRVKDGVDTLYRTALSLEVDSLRLAAQNEILLGKAGGKTDDQVLNQARDKAKSIIAIAKTDPRGYATLAEVEIQAGQPEMAMKALMDGLENVKDRSSLPLNLVRLQLENSRIDDARKTEELLEGAGYPRPLVSYVEGRIKFAEEKWITALNELRAAREDSATAPDLRKEIDYWIGRTYERLDDHDEAQRAYRLAIAIDPQYGPARQALANSLGQSGHIQEATEQVLAISEKTVGALLQFVSLSIDRNRELPSDQQDWKDLDALLARLEENLPDDQQVRLLHTDMLLVQGKVEEADEFLARLREQFPKQAAYWAASSALAMRLGNANRARQLLDEAFTQLGDSVVLRLAKGAWLAQSDATTASTELPGLADGIDNFSPADRVTLCRGLIPLSLLAGQQALAGKLSKQWTKLDSNNLNAWTQRVSIAVSQGDFADFEESVANMSRIEVGELSNRTEGPLWHYWKAIWSAVRADDPALDREAILRLRRDALEQLASALRLRPGWTIALLAKAQQTEAMAETEDSALKRKEALQDYLSVIERQATNASAILGATRLSMKLGDLARAAQLLEGLHTTRHDLSVDVHRMRSIVAGERNEIDKALEGARSVPPDKKKPQDYIWQAKMCELKLKQQAESLTAAEVNSLKDEAETALCNARQLSPQTPGPWEASVRYFVNQHRNQDVADLVAEGRKAIDRERYPTAEFSLLIAMGDVDAAAQALEAVVAAHPTDAAIQLLGAEFYLKTGREVVNVEQIQRIVADDRSNADASVVRACRRVLAVTVSDKGGLANRDAGLALVAANLLADSASILDLRTKATLLAAHPLPQRKREALADLGELLRRDPQGVEKTRQLLAQVHLELGNWKEALQYLRGGNDPGTILVLIRELLARNLLSEAERNLTALEGDHPTDGAVVFLKTELLFRKGEYATVQALIADYVAHADDASRAVALLDAGHALSGFTKRLSEPEFTGAVTSYLADAESYLRQRAELGVNEKMDLVSFLATHGKEQEALEIFDRSLEQASLNGVAVGASGLAEVPLATLDQKVEESLNAALAKFSRPQSLVHALIQFRTRRGQWQQVIELWQEMLQKDPNDFAAKNNLAEILALQSKQLDEAHRLIEEAIQYAGKLPALLDTRASVYVAKGDAESKRAALADMRLVVADSPNSASRRFHLARVYDALKMHDEAKKEWQKSVELGLDESQLHPLEGVEFRKLRDSL